MGRKDIKIVVNFFSRRQLTSIILKVQFSRTDVFDDAFDSEPEGSHTFEPLTDNSWITKYSREVQEAEQRNQPLQYRFSNIAGLEAW